MENYFMTSDVNFDDLAQKFSAARGEETYCDLFGAAFALPVWHFIAVGEMPNLSAYCAIFPDFFGGQPMVLAFTDTERLYKYVAEKNLRVGSADKPVVLSSPEATVKFSSENLILSVPMTNVIQFLAPLIEKGVKGIAFNMNKDSQGFHADLSRLGETKELVESKKRTDETENTAAEIDFDALARKANESGGAMEDLNRLFGAAFALPQWRFIARGTLPNVNPYIASKADYQNGQNMIRAFTDSKRLQRFAKENNLTAPDGSVDMLDIPTGGIVEYLEGFIKHGVYGVWFNSDTESDGFSIPLARLRPIKEHLAKLRASGNTAIESGVVPPAGSQKHGEPEVPMETVVVIIKDGLTLPSGFYKAATYACNFYCRVPSDWTEAGKLKEIYLEKFYEKFYGATWRAGNDDGSRYVVDHAFTVLLTVADVRGVDWTTLQNDGENHYWFYITDENGEIKSVKPTEFQMQFVASPPTSAATAPQKSNLENWGLARSADGEIEQIYVTPDGETLSSARMPQKSALERWVVHVSPGATDADVKFLSPGNVKFGTSLVPFYAAIILRLRDYQSSGDFKFIFNFAAESIENLTENVTSNDHGVYFRVRKFQYHAPNATADAATIDSNDLRHVQTGATLSMSFTLLQFLAGQSAALYFGMQGNKTEVERLLSAITPALEAAEFVPEKPK